MPVLSPEIAAMIICGSVKVAVDRRVRKGRSAHGRLVFAGAQELHSCCHSFASVMAG